jgi:hypothetical protein
MPAENFRAEPSGSPSSAAFAYDGISQEKNRAAALIILMPILEILFFSMAISADEKNHMFRRR